MYNSHDLDEDINDDSFQEEIITRPRSNPISINKDDIYNASNSIPINRTSSIGAEDQRSEGSCFAYASARLITRLITQMIPTYFTITPDESNLLYNNKTSTNIEKYKNCFVSDSTDLNLVRNVLSSNICPINKRYNHMILFYYTLFTIKKQYGCNGGDPEIILARFAETPYDLYRLKYEILDGTEYSKNKPNGYIISKPIDAKARALILEYISFIGGNEIEVDQEKELLSLNDASESYEKNWITQFPEGAKAALANNMYVGFTFAMPINQAPTINRSGIFDISPALPKECIGPIMAHIVIITHWEPNYVTILNTWGSGWGNNGSIKIPSENFYKFVMNPSCSDFSNPSRSMKFLYFNVTKGNTQYGLNRPLGTTNRRKFLGFGGKNKNHKTKKTGKNKNKKTGKNKKNKITKKHKSKNTKSK